MIEKIIKEIKAADKIAFFGHKKPDGDSMSSSYGLAKVIKKHFPKKEVVWVVDISYVKNSYPNKVIDESIIKTKIDDSFLTIVGDVSGKERIDHYEEFKKGKTKICFDHHQNEQDCGADIFWHEPGYPASTLQAFEIIKKMGIELEEQSALDLLVGILTDTGFFRYSLSNPMPPKYYAEMLKYVSDEKMSEFFNRFSERSQEDVEITSSILSNIKYDGKVAYVKNSNGDVKKYGAHNLKSKVNLLSNIKSYPIWVMFTDARDSKELPWEVSIRSNGPQVNEVASKFNGGGHLRAAGAKLPSEDQIPVLLKELNK